MDHEDAIRLQAAQQYVAGELPPDERDAFEEHFFECPECAEEVRWEQIFAANLRAVERERAADLHQSSFRRFWNNWLVPRPVLAFSLAANFVLALGFVYVFLTGRPGGGPQFIPSYYAPGPVRGEIRVLPPGATTLAVHFPPPAQPVSSYSYELTDSAGKRESAGAAQPGGGQEGDLYLAIPLTACAPGDHTLVVRASPGGPIASQLQFRTSR